MKNAFFFLFCFFVVSFPESYGQSLVIVSPHWEGIRYEFQAGFANWRISKGQAPVEIQWRDVGGTSEIVRYVQSEFSGKRQEAQAGIGIDLIFGGGIDPFVTFKKAGLLQSVFIDKNTLDKVGTEASGIPLYDKDHFWFAPTMSAFGIFCNQKVLSKVNLAIPQNWEGLLAPAFQGWITSADPRRSGSAHMFYEIILQSYGWGDGWNVILALTRNYRTILSNSSQAILDVVSGEVACCFAIDSQANAQISKSGDGNFTFTVPRTRSLFNGDGIAVLRGAPNPEAATSFIEFTLSERAQKLLYLEKGEDGGPVKYELNRLPVLPELFHDKRITKLNPFEEKTDSNLRFNSELSSNRWEAINDLLGIFAIEAKDAGNLENADCQSGLPEDHELAKLLQDGVWEDPVKRNRQLSLWRNRKYRCESMHSQVIRTLPFVLVLLLILIVFLKKKRK